MKRIAFVITAIMLALSITACGSESKDNEESQKTVSEEKTEVSSVENASEQSSDSINEEQEQIAKEKELNKEKAEEVNSLILAIGNVSLDSEIAIKKAQKAYDKLTAEQQELVQNYQDLKAATEKYDELKAEEVENLISAIGEVSVDKETDSENSIVKAQKAYSKLTKEQKNLVKNYADLEAAAEKYDELKAENTDKLISKIGDVTLDSEKAIEKARKAYDKLSDAQKELVEKYEILVSAEEALNELKEEEKQREMTVNVGDTVTSEDWSITLTNAYTSTILESGESSTYWECPEGYAFCILEFDVTCLNSTKPTIDGQGITNIVAVVNENTYGGWEYRYVQSQLWLPIKRTYLEANLPLHVYVYNNIPSANMNDKITINLKIAGEDKRILIN